MGSEPQEPNYFVRKPNVEPLVHKTRLAMKQSVKFAQYPKEPHFSLNWDLNAHRLQTDGSYNIQTRLPPLNYWSGRT